MKSSLYQFSLYSVATLALIGSVPVGPSLAKGAAHGKNAVHHPKPVSHHPSVGHSSPAPSAWTPDPKLLSQLEPEQSFGPYLMRVPTGYTITNEEVSITGGTGSGYILTGPTRPDGTAPFMEVVVTSAGPGYVTRSVDKLLKIDSRLEAQPGLVKSSTEDGETNGLQMSRQYFKFPSQAHPGLQMHGFFYATTDAHTDARMEATDAEPGSASTLPLLEAAARTLRKPN